MAGITDAAFRLALAEAGKLVSSEVPRGGPDVIWTEMIPLPGIVAKGKESFEKYMRFSEIERPIIFQFFGARPEDFVLCGNLAKSHKADGIDINMGCPDRNVEKQGAGACIIKSPALAREIVAATKAHSEGLPVSVKTRLGYANPEEMENWISALAETKLAAIIIHGRTKKERRKGKADWQQIKRAGEIIKTISPETIMLGNGDIKSKEEGESRAKEAEIDGYMVGRALMKNLRFFA